MATPATVNPFNFYPGRDGLPLQNGYLYFGEPFQDPELQPLQAYWDDANTQPAARPIRTINGYPARNGAPAQVFVGAQYSMRVRDSQGREVFYAPNVTAVDLGGGGLDIITASGGQTVVTLTNAVYTPGSNAIDIALNGIIQISGQDYFETGTNRITMASALSAGDQIRAFARSTFGLTQAVLSDWQAEVFDGDGTASQNFTLTRNPGAVANLDVSVAGETLRPLLDYTLSGSVVTITPAPAAGTDNVLIRYGRSLPQDALRGELASTASASDGAGMVKEDLSLNYVAGTVGWWDKHAGVSLLRYMPITKLAAIVAGTNTDDLSTYLQAALDAALAGNFDLTGHGYTYKSNSALTWQRSSAGHSTRLSLHSATLDFTGMGTSGSAFTVGATSTTYFIEQGRIILRDLTLLGPENTALDPRTDAPGTSTVGLDLQFAGGVTLDSVNVFQFYTQCHSLFTFPVKAINCNFRRAWIGLHLDEASNDHDWDGVSLPNCRYPILIKSVSTAHDSGKINNVTIRRAWMEGSTVGPVIDSGSGGSGATPIRGITFEMPYLAIITYDHFRFGRAWTLATPGTRGVNCSEFISDIRIVGGLFNPQSGVYSATQALVCFDTNVRCRDVFIDTCTLDVDTDSDVIVGAPGGGLYISRGFAGTSNAKYRVSLWDTNGAIARRMSETGGVLVGTAKTATATTGTVGHELKESGVLYTTADGATAVNTTRLNSDGTLYNFRRDGTSVGSISITTAATTYNTTSDYRRKDNVRTLDGAAALSAVQSWPIRTFNWRANGAPDVGVIAHELQAVKPSAVHGNKDATDPETGEEIPQGVDYSKLVPELVAAVQYLASQIIKE